MSGNGVPGLRLILYSCKGYTLRVVVVVVVVVFSSCSFLGS